MKIHRLRFARLASATACACATGLVFVLLAGATPGWAEPSPAPGGAAAAASAPAFPSKGGVPPAASPAPAAWRRLLLVGDSIVANVPGATWETGLPARLQSTLPRFVVWTYARGLWTVGLEWYGAPQVGSRASPDPAALRALLVPGDAVVILLGTNDFRLSRALDQVAADYGRLLDRVAMADTLMAGPGATVRVCVTPIWRTDADERNELGLVLADYSKTIRETCSKRGVAVVDGFQLIRPGEKLLLDATGVHPTEAGTEVLGRRLGGKLEAPLSRAPVRAPQRVGTNAVGRRPEAGNGSPREPGP